MKYFNRSANKQQKAHFTKFLLSQFIFLLKKNVYRDLFGKKRPLFILCRY